MAAITHTEVAADAALKLFKGRSIKVQTARATKSKGEDGKTREGFKTDLVDLAVGHVLSAKQWSDGRVTITTIDGRRHEATGTVAEDKDAAK